MVAINFSNGAMARNCIEMEIIKGLPQGISLAMGEKETWKILYY